MPAKKHDFTIAEIKAGILVILSIGALGLFVSVISGLRPPEETNKYKTYCSDTAGLNRGGDVRFGGKKAGRVTAITPDKNDQSRMKVDLEVKMNIPINTDSKAYITQTTLTSEKHLEITTGSSKGEPLPPESEIPFKNGGLFGQVEVMAQGLVAVLADARKLLGVEATNDASGESKDKLVSIAQIFRGVETTVNESGGAIKDARGIIAESKGDISKILSKLQDVEDSAHELVKRIDSVVSENQPSIKQTIGEVQKTVEDVHGGVQNVHNILEQVTNVTAQLDSIVKTVQLTLNNASNASGDIQGILQDNRNVIDEIILDLRETTRHLKSFSRTMSEQPQAVIRGKALEGRK